MWKASRTYILCVMFILSSSLPFFLLCMGKDRQKDTRIEWCGKSQLVVSIYLQHRADTGIENVRTIANNTRYSCIRSRFPLKPHRYYSSILSEDEREKRKLSPNITNTHTTLEAKLDQFSIITIHN